MSDASIILPPDSTGKAVDAELLAGSTYRQRFEVAGALLAEVMRVMNTAPAGTEYAAVNRPIINQYYDTTTGPTNITALNANLSSGVATANSTAAITTAGMETVGVGVTAVGVGTLTFQGSVDGANWVGVNAVTPQGAIAATTTTTGVWIVDCAGFASVRVTASAYTSGTFTVFLRATLTEGNVGLDTPLPTGSNTIGAINQGTSVATANLGWWMRIGASNGSSVGVTNEGALNVSANVHTVATQTAVGTSGSAVTLTIGAPGAATFHYITSIQIVAYAAAAVTGGATPITVTTTNFTNSPAFIFQTAKAIGTSEMQQPYGTHQFPGIKVAAANTATTIVCPATTGVIWRVNATWYNAA